MRYIKTTFIQQNHPIKPFYKHFFANIIYKYKLTQIFVKNNVLILYTYL